MGASGGEQPGGTIIRGPDGALYFIRDEMLEHFRLPEKLAKDAETLVSSGQQTGAAAGGIGAASGITATGLNKEFNVGVQPNWEPLARVEGPLNEAEDFDINAISKVASTVMCPSFLFEPGGPIE